MIVAVDYFVKMTKQPGFALLLFVLLPTRCKNLSHTYEVGSRYIGSSTVTVVVEDNDKKFTTYIIKCAKKFETTF